MTLAATDVSCYQRGLEIRPAISGQATLDRMPTPNNLWYRFIVTDGSDTDYYADNTGRTGWRPGSYHRRPHG